MELLQYLKKLFRYNAWANKETVSSIRTGNPSATNSLRIMNHIAGAEQLWFSRLKQEKNPLAVWPDLNLEECEKFSEDVARLWSDYLSKISVSDLTRSIRYVNSKNQEWSSNVEDILMHVVMHSAYHRGQIATDLRQNGSVPAYTDFIHSVREGLIE
ncbi:MAG TPA: DinB family protein [Blastocatellia bacterium]|nr:DinB family protein [Blastocatellia bacterium]